MFRGQLTQALGRSIRDGAGSITNIPGLLERVLEQRAWEERIVIETGERFPGFPSFAAYVVEDAPLGLGSDVDAFEQLIEHNVQALDLYQEALKRPAHVHAVDSDVGGPHIRYAQPDHTSTAGILRRLKQDRPDLHGRVLGGELSPNAASIEAGYRHRRLHVPIDDMDLLASMLRRHLDRTQRHELATRLEGE